MPVVETLSPHACRLWGNPASAESDENSLFLQVVPVVRPRNGVSQKYLIDYTPMEPELKEQLKQFESACGRAIEHLEGELAKIRAGKASPVILDGLRVDYYGSSTPLSQVANISAPDAKTLTIQPYERNLIPAIEKVIKDSNLGFNPQNDGILIRINLPMLTEERRRQLAKQAKEAGEDGKVAVRNLRRDANEAIKKLKKNGLPEDSIKAGEAEVQKITDAHVGKIDRILAAKEAEIMQV
jgi:ribosome recycling factor